MKPFNLEEAKAGKPVVTRDGKDVRILTFDKKGCGCIVALINESEKDEFACVYQENGTIWSHEETKHDLFMKAEKKKGWVNLYRDAFGLVLPGVVCATEADSKSKISPAGDYITTIKVEWEE